MFGYIEEGVNLKIITVITGTLHLLLLTATSIWTSATAIVSHITLRWGIATATFAAATTATASISTFWRSIAAATTTAAIVGITSFIIYNFSTSTTTSITCIRRSLTNDSSD